jgi:hypothetical protein
MREVVVRRVRVPAALAVVLGFVPRFVKVFFLVERKRNLLVLGARRMQRFARQQLDRGIRRGSEPLRGAYGNIMRVPVIVILKIFEHVADVQERITVQANLHEGRLHTGKDAGDFAFINTSDECELFFAFDVNFN